MERGYTRSRETHGGGAYMLRDYTEWGLHGEVRGNTNGEGIHTEWGHTQGGRHTR